MWSTVLLFPLKVVLIGIDFSVTLLTFGWINILKQAFSSDSRLRSIPVGNDESHRVHPDYKGKLATTPIEGVLTLYGLAKESFAKYSSRRCMGVRDFKGYVPSPENNKKKIKHFGDDIIWKSFQDVNRISLQFGAALRTEGLVPAPETTKINQKIRDPCCVAIFENTCPEWMMAALGAFSQSLVVTTIYSTLGIDAVVDAINDANISAIVCNKINVEKLVDRIEDMKTLKLIIYTNDLVAPNDKTILPPATPKGTKIVEFHTFCNESGNTIDFPPTPPKPDTCAVIMYTSGSTGKPKGVVITHRSLVAAIAAGDVALGIQKGKDVYLGYLPLAHILEIMAEFVMIVQGCTICYADPKTLTSSGAHPIGALEQYSPTLMVAVPKIWDVIKKGTQAKIADSSPVTQFLVNTALEWRAFAIRHGFDAPLLKVLVLNKFARAVGGKLRYAISGGGPINPQVQEFIRVCFGMPLIQGYALTETCASLTVQPLDDIRCGVAGMPLPSVEVKLVSTPGVSDKNGQPYLTKDRVDAYGNKVIGRGEVWVRGPSLSSGYYQMPQATQEVFQQHDDDDDGEGGFFATGDIGQFLTDGSLQIVDRKKNLIKLKGGEYIAMEAMEVAYGNSTFVDSIAGGICCYGDGDMDRPVALMQLSKSATLDWWAKNMTVGNNNNKKKKDDFEKMKMTKDLYQAVMTDLREEHARAGLSHLEKLCAVVFVSEPWTPENGCLTAANKLQRRAVITKFDKEFQQVKQKGIF